MCVVLILRLKEFMFYHWSLSSTNIYKCVSNIDGAGRATHVDLVLCGTSSVSTVFLRKVFGSLSHFFDVFHHGVCFVNLLLLKHQTPLLSLFLAGPDDFRRKDLPGGALKSLLKRRSDLGGGLYGSEFGLVNFDDRRSGQVGGGHVWCREWEVGSGLTQKPLAFALSKPPGRIIVKGRPL